MISQVRPARVRGPFFRIFIFILFSISLFLSLFEKKETRRKKGGCIEHDFVPKIG
jgi:hypothetical protein